MAEAARPLEVMMVSDVICPWCLLGQRRLRTAAAKLPGMISLQYAPWELAAGLPKRGVPKRDSYLAKFRRTPDPAAAVDEMTRRMTALFAAEGLEYSAQGTIGPTRTAHRLSSWALEVSGPSRQAALMGVLFEQYHLGGINPAEPAALMAAVRAVGLDEVAARAVLEDERAFDGEVSGGIEFAKSRLGATGVPLFVIHDPETGLSIKVPGAQDSDTLVRLFEQMIRKRGERSTGRAS